MGCFDFDFDFEQHEVPLGLQWPLAQLFPESWVGGMGMLRLLFLDAYVAMTWVVFA